MKIVVTDGCIASGVTVDGTPLNMSDMTPQEKKDILKKIIDTIDDSMVESEIFSIVQSCGEYEYLYHCEECGDDVCEWTMEI